MNIEVTAGRGPRVEEMPIEIVERKGKGHPDTLCDGAAEELSIALCEHYQLEHGRIQHHNVDKCVLAGGASNPVYGGGEVTKPIYLLLVGRAVLNNVPIDKLAIEQTRKWLATRVECLNVDEHLCIEQRVSTGSIDLQANYRADDTAPRANDTSFAVGFAPLSETEKLVRETELFLNGAHGERPFQAIGEDIKIMGVRDDNKIRLTVACAFISRHVENWEHYVELKGLIRDGVEENAKAVSSKPVSVDVNLADLEEEPYLTVTGTSAECGDDGQVGRGNRANGLITPYRPMTLEAVAGKNPVSHVGKIYNVMAQRIADEVHDLLTPDAAQVYCYMVSQIGRPITDPHVVNVELFGNVDPGKVRDKVSGIVDSVLSDWTGIRDGFLQRRWGVYYD